MVVARGRLDNRCFILNLFAYLTVLICTGKVRLLLIHDISNLAAINIVHLQSKCSPNISSSGYSVITLSNNILIGVHVHPIQGENKYP